MTFVNYVMFHDLVIIIFCFYGNVIVILNRLYLPWLAKLLLIH